MQTSTRSSQQTRWITGRLLLRISQADYYQAFENRVKADIMDFIAHEKLPKNRKIMCTNFVLQLLSTKNRTSVRIMVNWNKLYYFENTSPPTASIIKTKSLLNSVISDHKVTGSRFCSIYLKNFFLTTLMEQVK